MGSTAVVDNDDYEAEGGDDVSRWGRRTVGRCNSVQKLVSDEEVVNVKLHFDTWRKEYDLLFAFRKALGVTWNGIRSQNTYVREMHTPPEGENVQLQQAM